MMQVAKWGNSLAVRLPAAVVGALGLKPGDEVEIDVAGPRNFIISRSKETSRVLARLRRMRGRMPKGFRFDRLEANARR